MKKLKHYPSVWQTAPFSMEMFAHFEQDARLRNQEIEQVKQIIKKERRPRLKLSLNWVKN